jgi:hypothetical protein
MDAKLLTCDRKTTDLIRTIVTRLREEHLVAKFDALSLFMDLTVCHNLGYVDLARLRDAAIGDFAHDISGIHSYLDRETGELTDCFVLRCHNTKKH